MLTVSNILTTKKSGRTRSNRNYAAGWLGSLACLCVRLCSAQSFQNMDFEAAGSHAIPVNAVWLGWSLAATGWQHAAGADTLFVYHNPPQTNLTQAYSLIDRTSAKWTPLAGDFSLALSSGYYSAAQANSLWVPASISQEGLVPEDSHSFRLLANGDVSVYINSQPIALSNLGGDWLGGDVSAFAGQVVTLEIASGSTELHNPVMIDSLSFSAQPVPEPASLTLLAAGLAGIVALLRRGRRAS
jgi:hypothetical protein